MTGSHKLCLQRVRVAFPRPRVEDVAAEMMSQIRKAGIPLSGLNLAVAVGSRGIANLDVIVRATVEALTEAGARPFIIPAMGSHGGATADGQREVLAGYGVTEAAMGCPVHSSMEVVTIPSPGLEVPLFMDRFAFEADGVVLINRIKPHTDFHGRYESGLVKMAVIGLGKEAQASVIHSHGVRGLRDLIPLAAERIMATGKILLGVGVVENAYDETALIEAIPEREILRREPELLKMAHASMARLPVDDLDVLVVDRMGKDISGTGMDTNIIGRIRIPGEAEPAAPRIRCIVAGDLTEASHGNAIGVGLADVITRRLAGKIDHHATYINLVTSGFLERGKIPPAAPTDSEAFDLALRGAGVLDANAARVIRIRDTLHLGEVLVSPAVLEELRGREDVSLIGEPVEMFDDKGEANHGW